MYKIITNALFPTPAHKLRKPLKIGEVFARLTIIDNAPPYYKKKSGYPIYRVQVRCICNKILIVYEEKLRSGHTKSCGCLQKENIIKNGYKGKLIHTHARKRKHTKEYRTWSHIRERCKANTGETFKNYKNRGIKVCDRWLSSFENFLADMGPHPGEGWTIDRKNNNGDYEPSNCRWANWDTQGSNRRNNINVIVNGVTMNISKASRFIDVHAAKVYSMVKKLNITHQKAIDLLMVIPRPVNMRQFKQILEKEKT